MKETGQTLLLSIFLILLLLLSIPIIVFLNAMVSRHQTSTTLRGQGTAVAQEGLAYAMQLLSAGGQTAWDGYLKGDTVNFPFPSEFNSGTDVVGADGGHFRLVCNITDPRRQSYEVYVQSTAWMPIANGARIPTKSIEAFLSHKTIGAYLGTGLNAAAALEVFYSPTWAGGGGSNAALRVYNGPIIDHDPATTWTLDPFNQNHRFPRKFAVQGIDPLYTGPATPSTDHVEYWAFTSGYFTPLIDVQGYQNAAKKTDVGNALGNRPRCAKYDPILKKTKHPYITATGCIGTPNCAYFNPVTFGCDNGGPAIFQYNGTYDPGAVSNSNWVIFVDGNAEFDAFHTILGPKGAMVITGNLALGTNGDGSGSPAVAGQVTRCPPTCSSEYQATSPLIGCQECPNTVRQIDFQGFLYVLGNVTTTAAAPNPVYWTMDGVMRVEGSNSIQLGKNLDLQLTYNDITNRNILTTDFELQVDSQTEIAARGN